jgi:hypothetical protein
LSNQNERQARRQFAVEQQDPETMLRRFYIEMTKPPDFKSDSWEKLLEMMGGDDRAWFQQNVRKLASLNPRTEGVVALAVTPRERQFSALEYLLRFGQTSERSIVARVATDSTNTYGVAWVHPPGRIDLLSEVFLIREMGEWKVRRFLGSRDERALLQSLVEDKTISGEPLTEDEESYKKDPRAYPAGKREELLSQAGVTPDQTGATPAAQAAASPAPTP